MEGSGRHSNARSPRAGHALAASLAASAIAIAISPMPERWSFPTRNEPSELGRVASWILEPLAATLPVLEYALRADAIALGLALGLAASCAWAAYQIFRGPGRSLAAFSAGPMAAAGVVGWICANGSAEAVAFAIPAMLGVGIIVRALVHLKHVPPTTAVRTIACASACTVIDPRGGAPFLLAMLWMSWSHGEPHRRARLVPAFAMGLVPLLGVLALPDRGIGPLLRALGSLHFGAPDLAELARYLPEPVLHTGFALVLLLVLPLRWRGGPILAALTVLALTLRDATGRLAPTPVLLVAAAVGASGWVWLAGSLGRRETPWPRRWAATGSLALGFATFGPSNTALTERLAPVAVRRPTQSLLRLYERGLIAPGDVLVAVQPWLRRAVSQAQAHEGFRPDLVIAGPSDVGVISADGGLLPSPEFVNWNDQHQRVLSDSFDLAGRWDVHATTDSGSLYWLLPHEAPADLRDFTNLRDFQSATAGPGAEDEALRVALFHLERARYRRALGHPDEAALALPLPGTEPSRLADLLDGHPPGSERLGSELAALPETRQATVSPKALSIAEAGDLAYGAGLESLGSELLIEAAHEGHPTAYEALARWQLRGGEQQAASQTLAAIASTPELRESAAALLFFALERRRRTDALGMRDALVPSEHGHPAELSARLAILADLFDHAAESDAHVAPPREP